MKNYSFHIKSPEACNIYVNGSFVGLIDNVETFALDLAVYSSSLIITKEPISANLDIILPYSVKISTASNTVQTSSALATVVPFGYGEYDIILQTSQIKHHGTLQKVYNETFENFEVIIFNDGQNHIFIYQNSVLTFNHTTQQLHAVFCENKPHALVVQGANDNANHYLLIIEKQNFMPIVNTFCKQVEQNASEITFLKHMQDIAKHGKVQTYNTQTGVLSNAYFVYLENEKIITQNPVFIPYAFLEAVKVENYELAQDYLSDNLKTLGTPEHIKNFFPNFENIYYNAYNTNKNLINYTLKTTNGFKNYDFTILNEKINEIEENSVN